MEVVAAGREWLDLYWTAVTAAATAVGATGAVAAAFFALRNVRVLMRQQVMLAQQHADTISAITRPMITVEAAELRTDGVLVSVRNIGAGPAQACSISVWVAVHIGDQPATPMDLARLRDIATKKRAYPADVVEHLPGLAAGQAARVLLRYKGGNRRNAGFEGQVEYQTACFDSFNKPVTPTIGGVVLGPVGSVA